jgi:DNA-binding IclR family transcriptional regulator
MENPVKGGAMAGTRNTPPAVAAMTNIVGAESATIKSARRVLEVLEYFAQGVARATVKQIANDLGYPQSSTSMLLASLVKLGYLRFDPDDRCFSPTLRVMLLGSWLQDQLFGQGSLVASMERLRLRTGQTVMIGLRQGVHVRFILSLQSRSSPAPRYPVGVLRPVCQSAVGKVLLSDLADAEALRIARHANAMQVDPAERVSTRELLAELAQVRAQGWALSMDYPQRNLATLAVALPQMAGQPPMALTVGSRKSTMQTKHGQLLTELRAACRALAPDHARPPSA